MLPELLIVGLAAWRLARLFCFESGPWDAFEKLRRLVGVPAEGHVEGFLPTLFTCPYCFGFWSALAMLAVLERGGDAGELVVVLIAAWGVVALLEDLRLAQ